MGMQTVDPLGASAQELAGRFAHTLVPIGLAYVVAHYFSLLAYEGQRVAYLVSDPLGTGANIFGTSSATVDYTLDLGDGDLVRPGRGARDRPRRRPRTRP